MIHSPSRVAILGASSILLCIGIGVFAGKTMAQSSLCGNGHIDPGEQCDDAANNGPGKGCTSSCKIQKGYDCIVNDQGSIKYVYRCHKLRCGDNIIDREGTAPGAKETCDDGNARSGDGCSATCQIEKGYTCSNLKSKTATYNCHKVICGDGVWEGEAGETCDPGKKHVTGCSHCHVQSGFKCSGFPTTTNCQHSCGDGQLDNEECDDGIMNGQILYTGHIGCTKDCKLVPNVCGNGVVDPGEQCDIGAQDGQDYRCSRTCTKP